MKNEAEACTSQLKKKQQSDWSSRPFICISPHQRRLEEKLYSSILKFAHCSEKHFLNCMWCYIHYGNLCSNAVILQPKIIKLAFTKKQLSWKNSRPQLVHKQKISFLKSPLGGLRGKMQSIALVNVDKLWTEWKHQTALLQTLPKSPPEYILDVVRHKRFFLWALTHLYTRACGSSKWRPHHGLPIHNWLLGHHGYTWSCWGL